MLMATHKQIHPMYCTACDLPAQHTGRCTITEFNGSCGVRVHHRLYHECNFPPRFPQRPSKGLLTESMGTSEISQANRAWWIIQSKFTTLQCCHICRELPHMQDFAGVYLYVGLRWCIFTCWTRGLCCLGCFEFWSLDSSPVMLLHLTCCLL